MSQFFVGFPGADLRNAQRNPAPGRPRLRSMKSRFPTDQRATWRERFVAIARQAGPAGSAPQDRWARPRVRSLSAKVANRLRFAAISTH